MRVRRSAGMARGYGDPVLVAAGVQPAAAVRCACRCRWAVVLAGAGSSTVVGLPARSIKHPQAPWMLGDHCGTKQACRNGRQISLPFFQMEYQARMVVFRIIVVLVLCKVGVSVLRCRSAVSPDHGLMRLSSLPGAGSAAVFPCRVVARRVARSSWCSAAVGSMRFPPVFPCCWLSLFRVVRGGIFAMQEMYSWMQWISLLG